MLPDGQVRPLCTVFSYARSTPASLAPRGLQRSYTVQTHPARRWWACWWGPPDHHWLVLPRSGREGAPLPCWALELSAAVLIWLTCSGTSTGIRTNVPTSPPLNR